MKTIRETYFEDRFYGKNESNRILDKINSECFNNSLEISEVEMTEGSGTRINNFNFQYLCSVIDHLDRLYDLMDTKRKIKRINEIN